MKGLCFTCSSVDTYLAVVDGADHAFCDQYNGIDILHRVVVVTVDNEPVVSVGRSRNMPQMWLKRSECSRSRKKGTGYARLVPTELENWAQELGYTSCILETGRRTSDAVSLYQSGLWEIPNYGQYVGVDNSICFEKYIAEKISR